MYIALYYVESWPRDQLGVGPIEAIYLRKLAISFVKTALVLVSVAIVDLSVALSVARFAMASRA